MQTKPCVIMHAHTKRVYLVCQLKYIFWFCLQRKNSSCLTIVSNTLQWFSCLTVFSPATHIEMQIESILAVLLCAACCILLLISFKSTTKRFLLVAIILPCGGKLNSYLEILLNLWNSKMIWIYIILQHLWEKSYQDIFLITW